MPKYHGIDIWRAFLSLRGSATASLITERCKVDSGTRSIAIRGGVDPCIPSNKKANLCDWAVMVLWVEMFV